ncbi:MAG TPA: zf-HC2 domain-containing protein [Rubrobacteraceae bacterium]|nr:zf-HC2 domain-containing protein [Rubrobacteraceae bacterium]HZG62707.1 zf-HC2 domain-containing protein [Rubrobacteraceae bacterium]
MSVEELLPAYAAGELSEEESERVEVALAESQRLRVELSRYERLFVLLSAAEEVRVPADLRRRVTLQLTMNAYLDAAADLLGGILGAYGRALVYFLRLA